MAHVAKIAISLQEELLKKLDDLAKEFHKSRSAIVQMAIKSILDKYAEQRALGRAKKIYKEIARSDKRLNKEFLSVSLESLSK